MKYKIEKNIATPKPLCKTMYPFKDMQIGDSFFIKEIKDRERVRAAAHMYRARVEPKFWVTIREVPGGWRLWRIDRQAVLTNKLKTA